MTIANEVQLFIIVTDEDQTFDVFNSGLPWHEEKMSRFVFQSYLLVLGTALIQTLWCNQMTVFKKCIFFSKAAFNQPTFAFASIPEV